jgi:hypothetical protein
MCASPKFCETNLQLLFTILLKAQIPALRANVMVALGDMAFRFPNLIEPWSAHMYGCLKDGNEIVRKHALLVVIHLILNDMQKAKRPIADISKCLVDDNVAISNLAKLFFTELAQKGKNPVYNVLPDVISRLSQDEDIDSQKFRYILKYLISFIQKDKQMESLVEKLCHRFHNLHIDPSLVHASNTTNEEGEGMTLIDLPSGNMNETLNETLNVTVSTEGVEDAVSEEATEGKTEGDVASSSTDVASSSTDTVPVETKPKVAKEMSVEATTEQRMMHKQCRDVAYCLSQLSYTNFAPLKKLIDCYRFYSNKVGDKEVYNSFVTVLNKGRKFAKAETKQLLDEFEIKLREAHEKALEEDQVDYKASTSSRSTGRRGKASIEVSVISIAEEEEEEEEEEVVPVAMKAAAKKPPAKKKAPPKKKKKQESSSEEEEEEEEESVEGSDLDEEA